MAPKSLASRHADGSTTESSWQCQGVLPKEAYQHFHIDFYAKLCGEDPCRGPPEKLVKDHLLKLRLTIKQTPVMRQYLEATNLAAANLRLVIADKDIDALTSHGEAGLKQQQRPMACANDEGIQFEFDRLRIQSTSGQGKNKVRFQFLLELLDTKGQSVCRLRSSAFIVNGRKDASKRPLNSPVSPVSDEHSGDEPSMKLPRVKCATPEEEVAHLRNQNVRLKEKLKDEEAQHIEQNRQLRTENQWLAQLCTNPNLISPDLVWSMLTASNFQDAFLDHTPAAFHNQSLSSAADSINGLTSSVSGVSSTSMSASLSNAGSSVSASSSNMEDQDLVDALTYMRYGNSESDGVPPMMRRKSSPDNPTSNSVMDPSLRKPPALGSSYYALALQKLSSNLQQATPNMPKSEGWPDIVSHWAMCNPNMVAGDKNMQLC